MTPAEAGGAMVAILAQMPDDESREVALAVVREHFCTACGGAIDPTNPYGCCCTMDD